MLTGVLCTDGVCSNCAAARANEWASSRVRASSTFRASCTARPSRVTGAVAFSFLCDEPNHDLFSAAAAAARSSTALIYGPQCSMLPRARGQPARMGWYGPRDERCGCDFRCRLRRPIDQFFSFASMLLNASSRCLTGACAWRTARLNRSILSRYCSLAPHATNLRRTQLVRALVLCQGSTPWRALLQPWTG